MAGKTILYEWLGSWEEALDGPAPAYLDDFIKQNCRDGEPGLVAEFRRRADFLRSINADLRAFGAPADTGPTLPGSTDAGPGAQSALRAGQDLVPGYPLERFLGRDQRRAAFWPGATPHRGRRLGRRLASRSVPRSGRGRSRAGRPRTCSRRCDARRSVRRDASGSGSGRGVASATGRPKSWSRSLYSSPGKRITIGVHISPPHARRGGGGHAANGVRHDTLDGHDARLRIREEPGGTHRDGGCPHRGDQGGTASEGTPGPVATAARRRPSIPTPPAD